MDWPTIELQRATLDRREESTRPAISSTPTTASSTGPEPRGHKGATHSSTASRTATTWKFAPRALLGSFGNRSGRDLGLCGGGFATRWAVELSPSSPSPRSTTPESTDTESSDWEPVIGAEPAASPSQVAHNDQHQTRENLLRLTTASTPTGFVIEELSPISSVQLPSRIRSRTGAGRGLDPRIDQT